MVGHFTEKKEIKAATNWMAKGPTMLKATNLILAHNTAGLPCGESSDKDKCYWDFLLIGLYTENGLAFYVLFS